MASTPPRAELNGLENYEPDRIGWQPHVSQYSSSTPDKLLARIAYARHGFGAVSYVDGRVPPNLDRCQNVKPAQWHKEACYLPRRFRGRDRYIRLLLQEARFREFKRAEVS